MTVEISHVLRHIAVDVLPKQLEHEKAHEQDESGVELLRAGNLTFLSSVATFLLGRFLRLVAFRKPLEIKFKYNRRLLKRINFRPWL